MKLLRLIETLETSLGRVALKDFLPLQPGDVPSTFADIEQLTRASGFRPSTSIEDGVAHFVAWYRDFYKL